MLRNENIICISSIDWDFIWQGHQEIMSTLVKNGNRVLFIENTGVRAPGIRDISRIRKRIRDYLRGVKGIRKEKDNLYIFSPILLPFPYSWLARKINRSLLIPVLRRWIRIMDFSDPIIWTFLPTGLTLDVADAIDSKLLLYYCIDNFSVSSASAGKVVKTEKRLLERADLVFVTSSALYKYCSGFNKKVSLFPFGVNIERFQKAVLEDTPPPDALKGIPGPIIGYVGGVHKWIDFDLIKEVALKMPRLSFVFIGPLQVDVSSLSGIKNIHFLGNKRHEELPRLLKNFSVAIIPYQVNEYTQNVYPTKLNEYLSMGKPVISTDLAEIKEFNRMYSESVYIVRTKEEFCAAIEKARVEDNESLIIRRMEIARDNSWINRIEQMSSIIENAVSQALIYRESRWKESLLGLYRMAKKRFLRLTLLFGLVYGFIFYTPVIWFIAEPLKLQDTPGKADAIVVFAGGVGESGKPHQGYEERVQYAVELYNQKYAENIIFSSGYMHVYKEPLIMKALAVSLGVPEGAIILEDQAKNTYENVLFSTRILLKNKWHKILLVSSPYHMRRASLVFIKNAREIEVDYTPMVKSLFYAQDKPKRIIDQKVNLEQIKAIFHEYLGILYYWYKGWI